MLLLIGFTSFWHNKLVLLNNCKIYYPKTGLCKDNDVKINDKNYPLVYLNTEWLPFCREHLLEGAQVLDEICKKLNYNSGELLDEKNLTTQWIGRCYNGDNDVIIKKEGRTSPLKCLGGNDTKQISCTGEETLVCSLP